MNVRQPATSPWIQTFEDYVGLVIRITVTFNQSTRAVTGVTVYRDPGCQFTVILLGVGPDGTPDSSTRSVVVPDGTTVLTGQQLTLLASRGLATIEDFESYQITAGR